MSFSSDVKKELFEHIDSAKHCQSAEAMALIQYLGGDTAQGVQELANRLSVDSGYAYQKCFTILKKAYNIVGSEELLDSAILEDIRTKLESREDLLKRSCCRRAYLRGAYLARGSMSDPGKAYHLEIVAGGLEQAQQLIDILSTFGLEAKKVLRKGAYVVYMKEASQIVDFLGLCQAHVSLMEMENQRIVREVRGSINRKVNCETANIAKTVKSATKQIEDIRKIQDRYGLDNLPDNLREMAEIRLQYPEESLVNLGGLLDPPVGKSGVNHRLRRLSELASRL